MTTPTDFTPVKRCSKCREYFPATNEYFHKNKRQQDGLNYYCKPCACQGAVEWKNNNREFYRESRRKQFKKYAKNHPDKVRETKRRYRANNREKINESKADYRRRNPNQLRAEQLRRRARENDAPGSFTQGDLALQYQSQKGLCWWCGKALNDEYHADHLIPLDRGGTNWPNNIVCSCQHCNCSRQNKLPHEWNGRLF